MEELAQRGERQFFPGLIWGLPGVHTEFKRPPCELTSPFFFGFWLLFFLVLKYGGQNIFIRGPMFKSKIIFQDNNL